MEIKKEYTKLIVPHEGGELCVILEPVKGNYESCRNKLKDEGFSMITSPELASLLGDVYKTPKGEYESKIRNIINKAYARSSTENLWLPKAKEDISGGVIGYDNPDTTKKKASIKKSTLIDKLRNGKEISIKGHPVLISKDGSVRFTPFGYETGRMNALKLARNPYNIVLHGEEGAEKIAEVASTYRKNPWLGRKNPELRSLDTNISEEKIILSALGDWGFGGRLVVDGYFWGDGGGGRAFGVCADKK